MLLNQIVSFLKEKEVLGEILQWNEGNKDWIEHSSFFDSEAITHIESPLKATYDSLTFLEKEKYLADIEKTKAKVILTRKAYVKNLPKTSLAFVSENPYLAMAYLTKFFAKPLFSSKIAPKIAQNTTIAHNTTIGNGSEIDENSVLMAGVVIGENVKIGKNCILYPNVCIYNDCEIGDNVIIHANSVIGSDGFGYAHTKDGQHINIHHNGKVVLENEVEIGSNTSIDRAVFGQTRICKGTKIDNLVQIGHNCDIGEHSIIVSQAGISGSTTTGRNVVLGGQSGSAGHLHIGEFTQIGARAAITKSVPAFGKFSGHPLLPIQDWLKLQALFKKMIKNK